MLLLDCELEIELEAIVEEKEEEGEEFEGENEDCEAVEDCLEIELVAGLVVSDMLPDDDATPVVPGPVECVRVLELCNCVRMLDPKSATPTMRMMPTAASRPFLKIAPLYSAICLVLLEGCTSKEARNKNNLTDDTY